MKRREFIKLLGVAVGPVAASGAAARRNAPDRCADNAQRQRSSDARLFCCVSKGLDEWGWRDGRHIGIEYRWAAGDADRLRIFAKELVELKPDTIFAVTTPSVAALLQETRTLPIVLVQVSDPVGNGFVASLARPGGNVTGFTNINIEPSMGANGCSSSSRLRLQSGVSL
jgi:putative ABC transport system substrate-binding protein